MPESYYISGSFCTDHKLIQYRDITLLTNSNEFLLPTCHAMPVGPRAYAK